MSINGNNRNFRRIKKLKGVGIYGKILKTKKHQAAVTGAI